VYWWEGREDLIGFPLEIPTVEWWWCPVFGYTTLFG